MNNSKKITKNGISKITEQSKLDILKEVKGFYCNQSGVYNNFKLTTNGVIAIFTYDKVTASGMKRSVRSIKISSEEVSI